MGAGTSTATFFRSLGGSFGVAALGAVMTNRLTTELQPRVVAAVHSLPPQVQQKMAPMLQGGISINDPKSIKALLPPVRRAIEEGFVAALHPVFLVSAVVTVIAVVLCLALPNPELKGAGPAGAAEPGSDVDDAADMEAKAATMM
jgi:hypothetical protein